MKRRICALLAALCLLLCACGSEAESAAPVREAAEAPLPEPPTPATAAPWEPVPVYYDGLLSDRAYRMDGVVYLSPAALAAFCGVEAETELREDGFTLRLPGVDVQGKRGRDIMQAGARLLYTPGGFLSVDGQVYLPAQAAAHLFSLRARISEDPPWVELDLERARLLDGGSGDYYLLHYPVEDLYWLSHIIQAEAGDEPLAGQIGVGNVVLNRVQSPDFPDSIREVVVQRSEETVQFEPTANGSIHGLVDEDALTAACLCLEGFNTVGDSLYFVNPTLGDSSWFEAARDFTIRIGGHDFYG